MNTNLLAAGDQTLGPETDTPVDFPFDGPKIADAGALFWRVCDSNDPSFFTLPIFQQFFNRPYHRQALIGRFDAERLAKDYRQQLCRSEAVITEATTSVERILLCLGQDIFILLDGAVLSAFAPTREAAAKVIADFRRYLTADDKDKPGFHLVSLTPEGPHTELVKIDSCPKSDVNELALHYGDDFIEWERSWLERLATRRSGVSILVGPPGVGKTSYLKMLMSRFSDRFAFYYLPLSSFDLLTAPQFVSFWLTQNQRRKGKSKVAIVEDAEHLLLPRDEHSRAQVSNLLNIGDGFLGEHLRLQVIATTNVAVRQLDEAVQRPGRLIGTREFRRLTRTEASRLAQAKGLTLPVEPESWSLAEVYNGRVESLALETQVGFSPSR